MPPRQRADKKKKAAPPPAPVESPGADAEAEDGQPPAPRPRADKKKKKSGGCVSLLKTIGYFSLIIIIPTVLNYAALNQEAKALIPEGGVHYDIGWGQKLLMRCTGEGLPTVVLEAPIGQTSDVWSLVQPILAKRTRVCSYDRAGIGFSDRGYRNTSEYANDQSDAARDRDRTEVSTVERMVDDLYRLLSYSTNQPKPLLLVSVDFTTFISRFYTQLYEHEVAGLFLINPAVETLLDYDPSSQATPTDAPLESLGWPEYWNNKLVPSAQNTWLSSAIGFTRVTVMIGLSSAIEEPELKELLPSDVILRKKHLLCQPKHQSALSDELRNMNKSMNQLKTVLQVKPFPTELPITIATFRDEDSSSEIGKSWIAGQNMLSQTLLPHSKHVVLPGRDYLSLYKSPQHVATAILAAVDKWRKNHKSSA